MDEAGAASSEVGEIDARIGANLVECRRCGAFTSAQIAACAGLSIAELAEIENGRRRASASQLWILARELGASVHDLMREAAGARAA